MEKYTIADVNRTITQNFKKTGWKKFLYSCGGYGGRCGNCKHYEVVQRRKKEKRLRVKNFKDILENNVYA